MLTNATLAAEDHLRAHRDATGGGDDPRYGFLRSAERRAATTSVVFEQTYDGLPVWGSSIVVHLTRQPLRVLAVRSDARGGISLHRPEPERIERHLSHDARELVRTRFFGSAVRVLTRRLVVFRHEASDGVDRPVVPGQDRLALESALEVVKDGRDIAAWTMVTDIDSGAVLHLGLLSVDLDLGALSPVRRLVAV